ncbi:MAG TPA: SRPBCC family protein [Chloroflexota bacterium]|nr:SRPBCC family protein [Chloroflexota bacterium]
MSETVAGSPTMVFALLTDLERSPEWDPRVSRVTQMTRGPLRAGVILRGTIAANGEEYHLDDEVAEYDPPWHFGLRSVQGATEAISYTLVEEAEGITRLDVSLSYDLPDPPAASGLDDAALRQQIADGLAQSLRVLKGLIERESA